MGDRGVNDGAEGTTVTLCVGQEANGAEESSSCHSSYIKGSGILRSTAET
jgi:hypothetical protein